MQIPLLKASVAGITAQFTKMIQQLDALVEANKAKNTADGLRLRALSDTMNARKADSEAAKRVRDKLASLVDAEPPHEVT